MIKISHQNAKMIQFLTKSLYFVRSGHVYLPGVSGTGFGRAGLRGYGWSSRASSTRNDGAAIPSGYGLVFSNSVVTPSHGPDERYLGLPLRCLSTVLDI